MPERLLFILLCVLSATYFCWILARRLEFLRHSKYPLPSGDWGWRLSRTFSEVMLQTKVLRERPWVGLMHALVMWGFFAFAWVSAEHLWLGVRGLEHAEPNTTWHAGFAGVWAVAVLIGIVGLSYRRFVLRPSTLGPLSGSSAIVAVLIVMLMVTYLLNWLGLTVGTSAWRLNWWVHTAAFLGMLYVIPHSKHLHLLLGPVGIFFRSETTSSMRALREDDDDDLGMIRFDHLSAKDVLDVNACVECGRCTDACPANVIGGSLDPKLVVLQMQRGLLAGGTTIAGTAPEIEAGKAWVREGDLYQCLSCGACEEACPVGIEHVGAKILDLRRGLVSEGRTHDEKVSALFTTMERAPHNAWGAPHDNRKKLLESDGFPLFDGTQEWLLWLGCGISYDPHGQNVARAMKKLLDAAGVSWGVLARETCCGEPARRAGNEYLFMELSDKVIDALRDKKVKKLVTCDPHCTRMLDVDYRQVAAYQELGLEVVHHTEMLSTLLPQLSLRPEDGQVTFHDPCYLARGRGVTGEPRKLLEAAGAELVEMQHSRELTFCCGAGGAQLFIADDKVELPGGRINHRRFDEVVATGAKTVAAACPYCPIMLKDAAQATGQEDVQVLDVAEILASRIE